MNLRIILTKNNFFNILEKLKFINSRKLLLITPAVFVFLSMILPKSGLSIVFTNLCEGRGKLFVAIYDGPEGFLKEESARFKKIIPVDGSGSIRLELPDLPPGQYAVSCFHDLNGNGKLDKNFLGVPTEPYGFSNNARPKFRAPNWQEAKFDWQGNTKEISIKLNNW